MVGEYCLSARKKPTEVLEENECAEKTADETDALKKKHKSKKTGIKTVFTRILLS